MQREQWLTSLLIVLKESGVDLYLLNGTTMSDGHKVILDGMNADDETFCLFW
jgi:hypothetical protein